MKKRLFLLSLLLMVASGCVEKTTEATIRGLKGDKGDKGANGHSIVSSY